jgi:hypothetical protein
MIKIRIFLALSSLIAGVTSTGESCSTPQGSGTCVSTSQCAGTSVAGYCPGPSDIQCCVNAPKSGVYGLDICDPASVSTYSCFVSSGFGDFTVPRGFRSTGAVDTNVCTNLRNAKSAGIKFRDVYMFPCPVLINAHIVKWGLFLRYFARHVQQVHHPR